MNAFADDLAHYLGIADQATPWVPLSTPAGSPPGPAGGLLDPGCVRFHFAGYGEQLPTAPQNRLFLDVGNALRPGVLDHHHLGGAHGSTASLVLHRPDLVRAALNPARGPGEAFTVVLHEQPDLDGVVSAYLALELLTRGTFPPGSEALARYVDKVDEGSLGMSLANPYSLYAGYYQLNNRLGRQRWNAPQEHWREAVRLGLVLAGFIVGEMDSKGLPLPEVDAFGCPELFGPEDREEVQADVRRYEAKLREPATKARRAVLRLPGQFGGKVEVESLRVRDVQNLGDPERVIFFKDWARSDTRHSRLGRGFAALSVFHSEGSGHVRRCILSVRPDSGATLRGLGDLLDEAESARRQEVHGVDDRVQDPVTGQSRTPRPGYANADPWYDGRAHDYTIIDSPRSGTLLTAGEVEGIFLRFGEG
jgi:hypothetical protein